MLVADVYISHANALFGFVIFAVLTLLDFLTLPRAGCYEFDPNRPKT
jgi:hypothetical protein